MFNHLIYSHILAASTFGCWKQEEKNLTIPSAEGLAPTLTGSYKGKLQQFFLICLVFPCTLFSARLSQPVSFCPVFRRHRVVQLVIKIQ